MEKLMQRRTRVAIGVAGLLVAAGATTIAFVVADDEPTGTPAASSASKGPSSTIVEPTSTTAGQSSVATTSPARPFTPSTVTPNEPGGDLPIASPGDDLPPEATGCVDLPRIPTGASVTGQLSADVDGDGRDDLVTTYRRGSGDALRRILRVELADQGFEQPFGVDTFPSELALVAAVNLDDGPDLPNATMELFVVIGGSADHEVVGVFYAEGCVLRRAAGADGNPAEFVIGERENEHRGLRCDAVDGGLALVEVRVTRDRSGSDARSERSLRYALDHFEDIGSVTVESNLDRAAGREIATLDC
jgi:hypothetical protein